MAKRGPKKAGEPPLIEFDAKLVRLLRNTAADFSESEELLGRKLTLREKSQINREKLSEPLFSTVRLARFRMQFPEYKTTLDRVARIIRYERKRKKIASKNRKTEIRVYNALKSSVLAALLQQTTRDGRSEKSLFEFLIGYSAVDLVRHLELQFVGAMSWDNYGALWQIDHTTPKSWFTYGSPADEQFRKCWSLSNLKPMLAVENGRKGARYIG